MLKSLIESNNTELVEKLVAYASENQEFVESLRQCVDKFDALDRIEDVLIEEMLNYSIVPESSLAETLLYYYRKVLMNTDFEIQVANATLDTWYNLRVVTDLLLRELGIEMPDDPFWREESEEELE